MHWLHVRPVLADARSPGPDRAERSGDGCEAPACDSPALTARPFPKRSYGASGRLRREFWKQIDDGLEPVNTCDGSAKSGAGYVSMNVLIVERDELAGAVLADGWTTKVSPSPSPRMSRRPCRRMGKMCLWS
jgi:hypothetical protein